MAPPLAPHVNRRPLSAKPSFGAAVPLAPPLAIKNCSPPRSCLSRRLARLPRNLLEVNRFTHSPSLAEAIPPPLTDIVIIQTLTQAVNNSAKLPDFMATLRADMPLGEEVRRILAEKDMTLRGLALQAGLDPGFLVRVLQGKDPPSEKVLSGVRKALDLPENYFIEERRDKLFIAMMKNPSLVGEFYDAFNPEPFDNTLSRGMSSGRVHEPLGSPLTILRLADGTDPRLVRLGAAVLLRYQEDADFRGAVDEQFPEIEKLAPRATTPWRRRRTSHSKRS